RLRHNQSIIGKFPDDCCRTFPLQIYIYAVIGSQTEQLCILNRLNRLFTCKQMIHSKNRSFVLHPFMSFEHRSLKQLRLPPRILCLCVILSPLSFKILLLLRIIQYFFKPVAFHYRRTLSAGMASSLLARKKRSLWGSQDSCFSRRSRHLSFQATCSCLSYSLICQMSWTFRDVPG